MKKKKPIGEEGSGTGTAERATEEESGQGLLFPDMVKPQQAVRKKAGRSDKKDAIEPEEDGGIKICFVFNGEDPIEALNKTGTKKRLISYNYLKDRYPDILKGVVETDSMTYVDEEAGQAEKMSHSEFLASLITKRDEYYKRILAEEEKEK